MLHAAFFVTIALTSKLLSSIDFAIKKIKIKNKKNFSSLIVHEKILCAIYSNNNSEILILFEYFLNMYPCHSFSFQKDLTTS